MRKFSKSRIRHFRRPDNSVSLVATGAQHRHSGQILKRLFGAGQESVCDVDTGFLGEPYKVLNQVATDRFALID